MKKKIRIYSFAMSTKLIYVLPYLTTTTTTKINIKVEITFKYLLFIRELSKEAKEFILLKRSQVEQPKRMCPPKLTLSNEKHKLRMISDRPSHLNRNFFFHKNII